MTLSVRRRRQRDAFRLRNLCVLMGPDRDLGDSQPIPFPRLQNYIRNCVSRDETASSLAVPTRALIRWLFDLLRNLMILGFLLFIAQKTASETLAKVVYLALGLLYVYLWSYINPWRFHPFYFVKNRSAERVLNIVAALIVGLLPMLAGWYMVSLVKQVAASYAISTVDSSNGK